MSYTSDEDDSEYNGEGTAVAKYDLHNLAERGDEAALRELLLATTLAAHPDTLAEEGAEADDGKQKKDSLDSKFRICFQARDVLGCTPVDVAILHGQLGCLETLLEAGASPSTPCNGTPPLLLAVCAAMHRGKERVAAGMVGTLLQHGASALDADDAGRLALHWAAVMDLAPVVQPLIAAATEEQQMQLQAYKDAAAADPEVQVPDSIENIVQAQDQDGRTALALAARHGSLKVLQLLLAGSCATAPAAAAPEDPDASPPAACTWDVEELCKVRDKEGLLPAHLAALHHHPEALQVLLVRAPAAKALKDRKGRAPAQLAALRAHTRTAGMLLHGPHQERQHQPGAGAAGVGRGAPCLIIAPDECFLHRTAKEPYVRGSPSPPPENAHRLRVLTTPGFGALRAREFEALPWTTQGVSAASLSDVLRCHEWSYLRQLSAECHKIPDQPGVIGQLDMDTAISHHSYFAALKAAGACCQAVDDIMAGKAQTVFCAVRPPGHHAGPLGVVRNANDSHGSHGFCLLSNVAIAAAYAMNVYRHHGIKRVAILDFDVHHGNGTEAVVANVVPSLRKVAFSTPFAEGHQLVPTFKPWLGAEDKDNVLFASVQGYGRHPFSRQSWFYPGSGATADTRPLPPPTPLHPSTQPPPATADAAGPQGTDGQLGSMDVDAVATAPGLLSGAAQPAAAFNAEANGHVQAVGTGPDDPQWEVFPEDPDGEFATATTERGGTAGGVGATSTGVVPGADVAASTAPTYAGPRIINVGVTGPGGKRLYWRRAWRDKILPAVANFRPDMIFVSAGFDAHRKETLNLKYVGITEAEYEWVTDQIKQLANRFCQGRVVSVLEGGYNIHAGPSSTFARSVAAHVRALAEPHAQPWDPEDAQAERQAEARKREATQAAAVQAAAAELADLAAESAAHTSTPAVAPDSTAVAAAPPAPTQPAVPATTTDAAAQSAAVVTAAEAAGLEAAAAGVQGGGRSKRARRGEPVDYVALNRQLEEEKKAAGQGAPP